MADDAATPEPSASERQWQLPAITAVQIKRVPFQPPKLRYFTSYLANYKEAIEFLVRTNGPIRSVALFPALYVGDVPVTESAAAGDNVYRFLAFEENQLTEGAPITLGWSARQREPAPEKAKFHYRSPDRG